MKFLLVAVVFGVAVIIVIVAIISGTRGPGTQPTTTPPPPVGQSTSQLSNAVEVTNQMATESVIIGKASLTNGGYVVIHEATAQGAPGAVIGYTNYLNPGQYTNLEIMLRKQVKTGVTLFAMLHTDDGDKTYGFPDEDLPLGDSAGSIVLTKFKVQ